MLLLQYGMAFVSAAVATGIAYALVRRDFFLPLLARVVPEKWLFPVWIVLISSLIAIMFAAGWPPLPAIQLPALPRVPLRIVLVGLALGVTALVGASSGISTWLRYRRARRQSLKLLDELPSLLTRREYGRAIEVTKKYKESHLAKVIAAGLLEFEACDVYAPDPGLAVEAARRGMDATATITVAELKESLGVLATIGATAPFVGLFGTVIGIINAFGEMAKGGGGTASVAAGIAEAFATTAAGLFVAVPAVWAYNYFQNRLDRFTAEMANTRSQLVSKLTEGSADRVRAH